MKKINKYLVATILCSFLLFSCKTDDELYSFPTSITVENKDCLQIWDPLNFQLSKDYGSNIYLYSVYAWYGLNEEAIKVDLLKYDYFTAGIKFSLDLRQVGANKYIFLQLRGSARDKGFIGYSKIFKFKKIVTNDCIKWISYE